MFDSLESLQGVINLCKLAVRFTLALCGLGLLLLSGSIVLLAYLI